MLQKSDRLYNAFGRAASKVIRALMDTRWNSYLFTLEHAYQLRGVYTQFIVDYRQLSHCELNADDWDQIDHIIAFLQSLEEAIKRCEGDYVSL